MPQDLSLIWYVEYNLIGVVVVYCEATPTNVYNSILYTPKSIGIVRPQTQNICIHFQHFALYFSDIFFFFFYIFLCSWNFAALLHILLTFIIDVTEEYGNIESFLCFRLFIFVFLCVSVAVIVVVIISFE